MSILRDEIITRLEEQVESLQKQNKLMRECLERVSETDISDKAPDSLWLSKWRNDTKELAKGVLKQIGEMTK